MSKPTIDTMSDKGKFLLKHRNPDIRPHECCHTCTFWDIGHREHSTISVSEETYWAQCKWPTMSASAPPNMIAAASPVSTEEYFYCAAYIERYRMKPRLKVIG